MCTTSNDATKQTSYSEEEEDVDDGDGEEDAYGNDDDKRYNLSSNRNDEFARYFLELSLIAPVHRNDSSQRYLDRSSAVFAVLPRPRNNNNASFSVGWKVEMNQCTDCLYQLYK